MWLASAIIRIDMLQPKKSFWGKKPGFDVGDILHIGVNVLFVAVIYAMVTYWNLALLAVALVVLSKWRVLAVQPRFWLPNIKANLVDLIVGVSSIILIFQAAHVWTALFWTALYLIWLLFLKPQTQDVWVGMQALWAQFLGLASLLMIPSLTHHALVICLLTWLITWSAARHFFGNYEEPHYRSLGLAWGLICMQLIWVSLHWLQYYIVFDTKIALSAVIITILGGSLGSVYHSYKSQTLQRAVLIENGLFAAALLLVVIATASWTARL